MRKIGVVLAILATLLVAGPALAETFVIGPAMLGHPADDPGAGYSALQLDERAATPEAAAPAAADNGTPLRPWEEAWYQTIERVGI